MQFNTRVIGHELMGETNQADAETFVCVKLKVGPQGKAKTWKQSICKLYMSQADAERSFPVGGYVKIDAAKTQQELDLGARTGKEDGETKWRRVGGPAGVGLEATMTWGPSSRRSRATTRRLQKRDPARQGRHT